MYDSSVLQEQFEVVQSELYSIIRNQLFWVPFPAKHCRQELHHGLGGRM